MGDGGGGCGLFLRDYFKEVFKTLYCDYLTELHNSYDPLSRSLESLKNSKNFCFFSFECEVAECLLFFLIELLKMKWMMSNFLFFSPQHAMKVCVRPPWF